MLGFAWFLGVRSDFCLKMLGVARFFGALTDFCLPDGGLFGVRNDFCLKMLGFARLLEGNVIWTQNVSIVHRFYKRLRK